MKKKRRDKSAKSKKDGATIKPFQCIISAVCRRLMLNTTGKMGIYHDLVLVYANLDNIVIWEGSNGNKEEKGEKGGGGEDRPQDGGRHPTVSP